MLYSSNKSHKYLLMSLDQSSIILKLNFIFAEFLLKITTPTELYVDPMNVKDVVTLEN